MTERAARLIRTTMLVAVIGLLLGAASAAAASRQIEVASKGPGPAQFDHVDVHQYGPKKPKRVLVLMPGTNAGAGNFTAVAKDLVKRVDGLAVWNVDRRSQVLEQTEVFEQ